MVTGGSQIVGGLIAQGVDRIFLVPGESFLAVLDALHDTGLRMIPARHEGGAAMMAEAEGKLSGRPGIAFVTRGPGATNAAAGVHVAQQDATPMILCIGQVDRAMRDRDAFQEVDYRQFFGGMAKWVGVIDDPARIPEMLSRAFHVAMSGRPGPVVLVLPEDVLSGPAPALPPAPFVTVAEPAPHPADLARFAGLLAAAKAPMVIAGGGRWTPEAVAALDRVARRLDLPVACSFRRQMLMDHTHPCYAGDLGLGPNPALVARIRAADLVILLGARMSENPSQGFTLFDIPAPRQTVVHVHPGAEELGRIYAPALAVNATPGAFLDAIAGLPPRADGQGAAAHRAWEAWSGPIPDSPGALTMGHVIGHLRSAMPDAVLTNGAGNYAIWAHRFFPYRGWGSQVAPTSGSMGYGLPAAIAAKLRMPEREVVALAGDGCFQMTMAELGTAVQAEVPVLVLIADNGAYGTIRMHQERTYPGRVSGTDLINPDFAALARAYGCHAAGVTGNAGFGPALTEARSAMRDTGLPALLHLRLSLEALTPTRTLAALRAGG